MLPLAETLLQASGVYPPAERKKYLLPLLQGIIQHCRSGKTLIVGIQGGQGTGKTTLSRFLQDVLMDMGYAVESFSLDDFYTSYEERHRLAQKYPDNPFYQIPRGMPGTHRTKELQQTLRNIKAGKQFSVPIFDKSLRNASGDIAGERLISKRQNIVFVEGWCLGLPAVSGKELERICRRNSISLPAARHYKALLEHIPAYQRLWNYLGFWIMLKPLSPSLHTRWRLQQELELRQLKGTSMNKGEVEHFVEVFLPLTYVCYEKVRANVTLLLNPQHRISRVAYNRTYHSGEGR